MTSYIDALRKYADQEPGAPTFDPATVREPGMLTALRQRNELANAQHLQDLSGMAMPWQTPTPDQQAAQDRATEHIASGMNIGGVTAWHGSPYRFNKFDPSKVGTGEGAQVYGQGAYLAGAKPVAVDYQKGLSSGKLFDAFGDAGSWAGADRQDIYRQLMTDPNVPKDQKRFISALQKDDWFGHDEPRRAIRDVIRDPAGLDISPRTQRAVDKLGNLYKIDLPDPHVANMIDWDKPLFDQRELMKRLEAASNDPEKVTLRRTLDLLDKDPTVRTGKSIMEAYPTQEYNRVQQSGFGGYGAKAAAGRASVSLSEDLQAAGIPGVQYLDKFSRGGKAIDPTSNYVVFPEYQKDLLMLERNGQPMSDYRRMGQGEWLPDAGTLKSGESVMFKHAPGKDLWHGSDLDAYVNGDYVGGVGFFQRPGPEVSGRAAPIVEVKPEFQRQGLATQLYNKARELGGDLQVPGSAQSHEGAAFRKTYDALYPPDINSWGSY